MRLFILLALVLWSLLAVGAWALLAGPGDGLIGWLASLIGDPQAAGWAAWLLNIGQSLGFGLIVIVWLLGAIGLLVFGGLARRLLRR